VWPHAKLSLPIAKNVGLYPDQLCDLSNSKVQLVWQLDIALGLNHELAQVFLQAIFQNRRSLEHDHLATTDDNGLIRLRIASAAGIFLAH
jgi:hypothetical protein